MGDPNYYKKFGFRNLPDLIYEGVPQEVFLALPFTKIVPKGIVVFHEAFLSTTDNEHMGIQYMNSPITGPRHNFCPAPRQQREDLPWPAA